MIYRVYLDSCGYLQKAPNIFYDKIVTGLYLNENIKREAEKRFPRSNQWLNKVEFLSEKQKTDLTIYVHYLFNKYQIKSITDKEPFQLLTLTELSQTNGFNRGCWGFYENGMMTLCLYGLNKLNQPQDVLELACGSDDTSENLKLAPFEIKSYLGLDIKKVPENRDKFEYKQKDCTDLSEITKMFDLVLIRHQQISSSKDDWTKIFQNGLERLKPGGYLYITSYLKFEHDDMKLAIKLKADIDAKSPYNCCFSGVAGIAQYASLFHKPL